MSDAKDSKSPDWWPSRYPRLWPLLNSSIGLWFLSSVVLGGLGAWYTQNQNDQKEKMAKIEAARAEDLKNRTIIEKLDLEIGYRLSTAISLLADLDANIQRCVKTKPTLKRCESAQSGLSAIFTSRAVQPTMFPEFSQFSTLALVAELKRLAPESEKKRLEQIIFDMSGLFTMLEVAHAPLEEPKLVAGAILEKLVLPRWQQGFYYLDCSRSGPFC